MQAESKVLQKLLCWNAIFIQLVVIVHSALIYENSWEGSAAKVLQVSDDHQEESARVTIS